MKLESFWDVPDRSPTFYALCAVMLLEILALGPLERYVNKPESLPARKVFCKHRMPTDPSFYATLTNGTVIYNIGYWAGQTITDVSEVIWFSPTNQP